MSLIQKGRAVGYTTPDQVFAVIKERRALILKEKRIQEVLECNSIEDIKILMMHWLDQGLIK